MSYEEQIMSEHIFARNGDYCLYILAPNGSYLRVCPREDQADVTHAISPISLKLSQMIKVIKLFKSPK